MLPTLAFLMLVAPGSAAAASTLELRYVNDYFGAVFTGDATANAMEVTYDEVTDSAIFTDNSAITVTTADGSYGCTGSGTTTVACSVTGAQGDLEGLRILGGSGTDSLALDLSLDNAACPFIEYDLRGNAGSDTLRSEVALGFVTFAGGEAVDTYENVNPQELDATLDLSDAGGTVSVELANATSGQLGSVTISGGGGSETVPQGFSGVYGSSGDDLIAAPDIADGETFYADGWLGNDQLSGGVEAAYLEGGDGEGDDTLVAGAGPTTFDGGDGTDTYRGGASSDDTVVFPAAQPVLATIGHTAYFPSIVGSVTETIPNTIENLVGSAHDDSLEGNGSANSLSGGAGDDQIDGGGGADRLIGDSLDDPNAVGDDFISSFDGVADVIRCGPGNDSLSRDQLDHDQTGCEQATPLWPTPPAFTPSAPNPSTVRYTSAGEFIQIGTAGDDVLRGKFYKDYISGGGGHDKILLLAGNDRGFGGNGNDTVLLGPGNDKGYGQAGNDRLSCGTGKDQVFGGKGNDILRCRDKKGNDLVTCGPGRKDVAIVDRGDRTRGCEKVYRPRRR